MPPPPTGPIDGATGKALSVYKAAAPSAEAPPARADQISPERAGQARAQIEQLEAKRGEIDCQIAGLRQQKSEMLGRRRLLYAKGPDLEDAAGLAFRAPGLAEIGRRGGRDAGDLVFGASASGCQRAIAEAKGADKRTGRRRMVQRSKRADDLAERSGASVKGAFVANQHRGSECPRPIEDRRLFEPNGLGCAAKKDTCVMPSCDMYEAVKKVLDGAVPDRNAIERKITGARGALRDALQGRSRAGALRGGRSAARRRCMHTAASGAKRGHGTAAARGSPPAGLRRAGFIPRGNRPRARRRIPAILANSGIPDKVLANLPDVLLYESPNKVRLARQFGCAGRSTAKRSRTRSPAPRRVTKTRE